MNSEIKKCARETVETITAELDYSLVKSQFDEPIDEAVRQFTHEAGCPITHKQFHKVITDFVMHIYDINGQLARTLDLGQRAAGFYLGRTKAAYWDGKNEAGEKVASGVYFYQIKTGDFTATRRMVIVK